MTRPQWPQGANDPQQHQPYGQQPQPPHYPQPQYPQPPYGQAVPPQGQPHYGFAPPPPPATKKKRRSPLWLILVVVIVVLGACGGIIGAVASSGTSTNTAADKAAPGAPAGAKTTAKAAATSKAKTVTVLKPLKGNGTKNTAKFKTGDDWTIHYSYNCASFGMKGNFQVFIGGNDLNAGMVNELATKGSGTEPVYDDSGTHYLTVNSECSWTVSVTSP